MAKWASSPLASFLPSLPGDALQLVRPRLGFLLSWQESCAVHFHTHLWVVGPPVGCGCLNSAGSSGDPADSPKFALFPWGAFSAGPWGPYSPGAFHHSPYRTVCSPQERWCCEKRLVCSFSLFFYIFIHITCTEVESGFCPSHGAHATNSLVLGFPSFFPFSLPPFVSPLTKWMFIKNILIF